MHYFTTIIKDDRADYAYVEQASNITKATAQAMERYLATCPGAAEDCVYQIKTTRH